MRKIGEKIEQTEYIARANEKRLAKETKAILATVTRTNEKNYKDEVIAVKRVGRNGVNTLSSNRQRIIIH